MSKDPAAPRVAAIVGPYLSGKTSLLEGLLALTGAIARKGTVKETNMVGDASAEAKSRTMSTEVNVASTEYLGERWTFLDCPGSVELSQEAQNALMVADTAVVCCEPDPAKALLMASVLRFVEDHGIPHIIFINKMDSAESSVKATLEALQGVSTQPLVLREIPIRNGEEISGFVDLASERAFEWQDGDRSNLIEIPDDVKDREAEARQEMLESLADFDDALLENLLEDTIPATDEVFTYLTKTLAENQIVPVFFGTAESDNGVKRLMKALRHEAPGHEVTAARLGVDTSVEPIARVFKTLHAGHAGKLSFSRIWTGSVSDGDTLNGSRIGGISHMLGQKQDKVTKAEAGDVVALGRMDEVETGDVLGTDDAAKGGDWVEPLEPLFSLCIHATDRGDEVKLSSALSKLADEDTSLTYAQNQDTSELLLWGQGEVHLLIAAERMRNKFGLDVQTARPQVPYKETIRKPISRRSRHKKQSGGHGEFGDVHLDIKPMPRGSGFEFDQSISGGVVPRQYFPAVEAGVKEFMGRGPLGFQVVDISVTLVDGQAHAVDSSEMAFKKAAGLCMREAMPEAAPVLLEPICEVEIALPNEFTSGMQRLISGRRGQILGFDAKAGWDGWDEVKVQLPQSEMHDLVIELRSMTKGVGTFNWRFDHLQELTGKEAEQVVNARAEAS